MTGFGPQKIEINDIFINALGSLIAWIVWGILIVIITFALGDIIDIPGSFVKAESDIGMKTSAIFPIILSVVTLIGTTLSMYLTYKFLHLTNSQRYKKNVIILGQIFFFSFLSYAFFTPIYLYTGLLSYNYLIGVYMIHTLLVSFWVSILLEVLNNYRYILIGIYGSFVWLFVAMILTFFMFQLFDGGIARLMAMVLLLPIINFSLTLFKQLFEFAYFHYYSFSAQDQLWDIFYQIEEEEKEILREEEEKNTI